MDSPKSLSRTLRQFPLEEVLRLDLLLGLAGGVGAVLLEVNSPGTMDQLRAAAIAAVGIVVGAVIGGVAIMGAFLDQSFLRKLKAIGREPVYYMAPFLFTAWLGIVSILLLLILSGLPPSTPQAVSAAAAGLTGLGVVWTLSSVFWDLDMLVQFVGLQHDAADVEERDLPKSIDGRSRPG